MSDDIVCLFFFKRKTAYELRISDWSSDVCSSDLLHLGLADGLRLFLGDGERQAKTAENGCDGESFQAHGFILLGDGDRNGRYDAPHHDGRSEERRVGKECVSTCRSRGSADY